MRFLNEFSPQALSHPHPLTFNFLFPGMSGGGCGKLNLEWAGGMCLGGPFLFLDLLLHFSNQFLIPFLSCF